jgi:hypothetical protein
MRNRDRYFSRAYESVCAGACFHAQPDINKINDLDGRTRSDFILIFQIAALKLTNHHGNALRLNDMIGALPKKMCFPRSPSWRDKRKRSSRERRAQRPERESTKRGAESRSAAATLPLRNCPSRAGGWGRLEEGRIRKEPPRRCRREGERVAAQSCGLQMSA